MQNTNSTTNVIAKESRMVVNQEKFHKDGLDTKESSSATTDKVYHPGASFRQLTSTKNNAAQFFRGAFASGDDSSSSDGSEEADFGKSDEPMKSSQQQFQFNQIERNMAVSRKVFGGVPSEKPRSGESKEFGNQLIGKKRRNEFEKDNDNEQPKKGSKKFLRF
jgi:hypothetical protein